MWLDLEIIPGSYFLWEVENSVGFSPAIITIYNVQQNLATERLKNVVIPTNG